MALQTVEILFSKSLHLIHHCAAHGPGRREQAFLRNNTQFYTANRQASFLELQSLKFCIRYVIGWSFLQKFNRGFFSVTGRRPFSLSKLAQLIGKTGGKDYERKNNDQSDNSIDYFLEP